MAEDTEHPLLAHEREDELWDRVESAPPVKAGPTVSELLAAHPADIIRTLQRSGVQKLGEFEVEDKLVLGRIGDDSIVTMGADRPDIDYQAAWRSELGSQAASSCVEQMGWSSTIPVVAYVVNVRDACAPDKDGLLQPLLRRWQAGGLSYAVFALPAVQAVTDWKWSRFCRRLLLWELAFFMLWLLSFFTFTILFQDEETQMSLRQILGTARGRATVACDFLALFAMAPFVVIEVSTVAAYGVWGWATAWNLLDTTTYAVQVAIVTMHLGRLNISSDFLSILASAQCILLLFRLQYFSRVFRATRFAFFDALKDVLHSIKWYLLFLLLIMAGFAASFQILYRRDQEEHENFSNMGRSFVMMVTWVAGNADLEPLYKNTHNPVAASVLGILYVFILATVLVNMLISIMTNSLDKVTENEGLRMLLSKAQAIDELESTIPRWVERLFPGLYPPYLHVLRVDPDKLDAVKLDTLWRRDEEEEEKDVLDREDSGGGQPPAGPEGSSSTAAATSGGTQKGRKGKLGTQQSDTGGGPGLAALEAKVDGLRAELAEVKALLLGQQGLAATE